MYMTRQDIADMGLEDSERDTRNPLDVYKQYRRILDRPTFTSIEDAEVNMRAKEDERRTFIVESGGTYQVCSCRIKENRAGDMEWTYRIEYSFTRAAMRRVRDESALAIGRELVDSM